MEGSNPFPVSEIEAKLQAETDALAAQYHARLRYLLKQKIANVGKKRTREQDEESPAQDSDEDYIFEEEDIDMEEEEFEEAEDTSEILLFVKFMRSEPTLQKVLDHPYFKRHYGARFEGVLNGMGNNGSANNKSVPFLLEILDLECTYVMEPITPQKKKCAMCSLKRQCTWKYTFGNDTYVMGDKCNALLQACLGFFGAIYCVPDPKDEDYSLMDYQWNVEAAFNNVLEAHAGKKKRKRK